MTATVQARPKRKAGKIDRRPESTGKSTAAGTLSAPAPLGPHYRVGPVVGIQGKVTIGPANDPFEREADAVANRVTAGGQAPPVSRVSPGGLRNAPMKADRAMRRAAHDEELMEAKHSQRATEEEEAAVQEAPVQRMAEEEETVDAQAAQRDAEEEETTVQEMPVQPMEEEEETADAQAAQRTAEEEETPVQAAPVQRMAEEEETADAQAAQRDAEQEEAPLQEAQRKESTSETQAKASGSDGPPSMTAAASKVINSPGTGAPMNPATRGILESRMGADFSGVRVHEGSGADEATGALKARAFTHRNHIWLSRKESQSDLRLMAHETSHVLQQGAAARRQHDDVQRTPIAVTPTAPRVQRGFLGDLIDKVLQHVPGYFLLTVIIGRNPVTGATVARTPTNLVGGLMSLVPGGKALFENLKRSGAIARTFAWIEDQIEALGITWRGVKSLVKRAWDAVSVWYGFSKNLRIVKNIFAPVFRRAVRFARRLGKKILEFIFEGVMTLAGPVGKQVLGVVRQAGSAFSRIIKDPIGFVRNLIAALGKGFKQFAANIFTHLKTGLMGWLFGALSNAGIELPEKFDLKGIVSIVLQVLGLTYANLRAQLVKVIGEKRVARLEQAVEFVKLLVTEGLAGVWRKIVEYMGSLRDMVIGAIRDWVVTRIVTAAVTKLVSMFNPAGAVIQAIVAIYNTIRFFIERIQQIAALVQSVIQSIGNIAAGKLEAAANYVEQTMARTIPVIISFLARLIGLGGVSEKIKDIIKAIQDRVNMAIGKIVSFIVGKAKALLGKGKALAGKVVAWWKQRKHFRIGKEKHAVYVGGEGKPGDIMVASTAQTLESFVSASKLSAAKKSNIRKHAKEIDNRKRPGGASVSFTKTAGKEIAGFLQKIADLLVGTKGERPASAVKAKKLRSGAPLSGLDGDGKEVRVSPLSIAPGNLVGSKPYGESALWKEVRIRPNTYVRGHLLNHQVHGPGEIWNMTPIPGDTNTKMETSFEGKVKKAVMDENQVVDFHAKAIYGARPVRVLAAEQAIATRIDLTATLMKRKDENKPGKDPGNWKKTSTTVASEKIAVDLPPDTGSGQVVVKRLNLGNYTAKLPDSAEPKLAAIRDDDDAKEIASKALQDTAGIGPNRAEAILDAGPTTNEELLAVPTVPGEILKAVNQKVKSTSKLVLEGRSIKSRYENA